jgi:hypothetical protein
VLVADTMFERGFPAKMQSVGQFKIPVCGSHVGILHDSKAAFNSSE